MRVMKTPVELETIITAMGNYVFVEDLASSSERISGIGILVGFPPRWVTVKVMRTFRKEGKVFFFSDSSMEELDYLVPYAFILATRVGGRSVEELEGRKLGVLYLAKQVGVRRKPLKPWRIYRGRVCRGKRCCNVNWVLPISTYKSESVLFICDETDLIRRAADGRIEYPLFNLLFSYNFSKPERYVMTLAVPVFRYVSSRSRTVQT